jgi:hypothetical protein
MPVAPVSQPVREPQRKWEGVSALDDELLLDLVVDVDRAWRVNEES